MACKSDCAGNGRVPSTYLVCGASHIDELSSSYHIPQQTPSNTDNSTFSNMKSMPQCSRCLSTFSTISNVNKHMKTDCKYGKKIHFPCRNRGCKRQLTRVAYRNIHEKERCPFRTLTRPTISTWNPGTQMLPESGMTLVSESWRLMTVSPLGSCQSQKNELYSWVEVQSGQGWYVRVFYYWRSKWKQLQIGVVFLNIPFSKIDVCLIIPSLAIRTIIHKSPSLFLISNSRVYQI